MGGHRSDERKQGLGDAVSDHAVAALPDHSEEEQHRGRLKITGGKITGAAP
jgi:hypothetical protein